MERKTNICKDCMNGHHEVIGHYDCDCICHGNSQCFVCGLVLTDPHDIIEDCHVDCQQAYDEQEASREAPELYGRYPWEQ